MTGSIVVRRAPERFHTDLGWLDSWHSFSFGHHYDPNEVGHGLLIVSNDDRVRGGGGFGTHPHRDMEIVTWVLSGALEHRDTLGTHGIITPGLAQRMSAGTGIQHSEMNASATESVHFVQMWVPPAEAGIAPSYEQADVTAALDSPAWVRVAGGPGTDAAVTIHQPDAALLVARLGAGDTVEVPEAPHAHVFVAVGAASLDGAGDLSAGDAARLTDAGSRALTGSEGGAEVLVWATA